MTTLETLQFIELGVLIRAEQVDTRLVNETLLRRSKIILESDITKLNSTIVTPVHSKIEFENGLAIVADQNRLWFTQRGEFSEDHENRCPNIAMTFLDQLNLRIPVDSVDTIFKAVLLSSAEEGESRSTSRFFNSGAQWSLWNGIIPKLCFKAIYQHKNTTTTLDVGIATKSDNRVQTGEFYEINFHRELLMSSTNLKYSCMMDILTESNADRNEFKKLISKFRNV